MACRRRRDGCAPARRRAARSSASRARRVLGVAQQAARERLAVDALPSDRRARRAPARRRAASTACGTATPAAAAACCTRNSSPRCDCSVALPGSRRSTSGSAHLAPSASYAASSDQVSRDAPPGSLRRSARSRHRRRPDLAAMNCSRRARSSSGLIRRWSAVGRWLSRARRLGRLRSPSETSAQPTADRPRA